MAPTIKDIARKSGVSVSSVSEILNSPRASRYAKKTVSLVKRTARDIGYQPHHIARSLKTGRTYMVGITSVAPVRLLYNQPYAAELYTGIGDVMSRYDYSMVFHQIREIEKPQDAVRLAQAGIVDGLIYILVADTLESFLTDQLALLQSLPVPFVVIHSLRRQPGCHQVGLDCISGAYQATEHLIRHGYATIGIAHRAKPNAMNRDLAAGYIKALRGHGRRFSSRYQFTYVNLGTEGGYETADQLVTRGAPLPRALLVTDDAIAHGMIRRFTQAGIRVPDEVAVIGFGNLISPGHITNELTTIDQPARKKGALAAQMLLDIIERPEKMKKATPVILKPDLIIRKSCGC